MELFFLCRGLHGAFVLLLSAPTCSGPCAVVWNTYTRHFCCSVTPLLLSVLVQSALSTSSAVSGRCSRISPSRSLVEGLVAPPSCFFRAALSLPSLYFDCFKHPFCRGILAARVSCALRLLTWPSASRRVVSRARHRLHVTSEMLGFCPPRPGSCPSPPSIANSTLKSAQFVCHSRRHHSSCLFMFCLFEQLDTVGVSARPRVDVLH